MFLQFPEPVLGRTRSTWKNSATLTEFFGIGMSNGPDSFNGITKRVSVRVKLIKTKPKETQ